MNTCDDDALKHGLIHTFFRFLLGATTSDLLAVDYREINGKMRCLSERTPTRLIDDDAHSPACSWSAVASTGFPQSSHDTSGAVGYSGPRPRDPDDPPNTSTSAIDSSVVGAGGNSAMGISTIALESKRR